MQRVSSNTTIVIKLFLPTFWIVFFGAFTISALISPYEYIGRIPAGTFKIGVVLFYLSGLAMFYFTLFKLKRVEMGDDSIYVTNYFKHIRYPYRDVEKVEDSDIGFFQTASIQLKAPGSFGSRLTFITSRANYRHFWETHPELERQLRNPGDS